MTTITCWTRPLRGTCPSPWSFLPPRNARTFLWPSRTRPHSSTQVPSRTGNSANRWSSRSGASYSRQIPPENLQTRPFKPPPHWRNFSPLSWEGKSGSGSAPMPFAFPQGCVVRMVPVVSTLPASPSSKEMMGSRPSWLTPSISHPLPESPCSTTPWKNGFRFLASLPKLRLRSKAHSCASGEVVRVLPPLLWFANRDVYHVLLSNHRPAALWKTPLGDEWKTRFSWIVLRTTRPYPLG